MEVQSFYMVLIICGVATLLLMDDALRILATSFHALEWDALIFFTIGRGILNGLTPYIDLFESKPPGIFFLAITSLLISKGDLFYRLLSGGCLVLLSIGPLIAYSKALPDRRVGSLRLVGGLLVFILGMLSTLYLQERAPGGQAEFFGSVFGALFVYSMATAEDRWAWPRIIGNALLIMGAVGIKEPFLFTIIAAAILLGRTPKHVLNYFLIPLAIGGALGVILLFILGFLGPYIDVYLPTMVASRIHMNTETHLPLWARGFAVRWLYGNLTQYFPPAPLFGYMIGSLFVAAALRWREQQKIFLTCTALVAFACLFYLMFVTEEVLILANFLHWGSPLIVAKYNQFLTLGIALLLAFIPMVWYFWKQKFLWRFGLLFPVLYLSTFAVGSGGYIPNHFAFAFPVYVALIILFAQSLARASLHPLIVMLIGSIAIWSAFWYQPSDQHLGYLAQMRGNLASVHRDRAEKLDALLDACGVNRYVSEAGYLSGLGFTQHSPMGPMPTIGEGAHNYLPRDHRLFVQTMETIVREGTVLAMAEGRLANHPLREFFAGEFTDSPPSCAKPYLPVEGLVVLFRKGVF